jgi:hypothetical protein
MMFYLRREIDLLEVHLSDVPTAQLFMRKLVLPPLILPEEI